MVKCLVPNCAGWSLTVLARSFGGKLALPRAAWSSNPFVGELSGLGVVPLCRLGRLVAQLIFQMGGPPFCRLVPVCAGQVAWWQNCSSGASWSLRGLVPHCKPGCSAAQLLFPKLFLIEMLCLKLLAAQLLFPELFCSRFAMFCRLPG